MNRLVIPYASSDYPCLGVVYTRCRYAVNLGCFQRTGKTYYNSEAEIPDGYRMATAVEEMHAESGTGLWRWTITGLRVPEGYSPKKFETDKYGGKHWSRVVLIGDDEVGEILVPESGDVIEIDGVFGLPMRTEPIGKLRRESGSIIFWFNPKPERDPVTGKYDVAVAISDYRSLAEEPRRIIDASSSRSSSNPDVGYRIVQGPLTRYGWTSN